MTIITPVPIILKSVEDVEVDYKNEKLGIKCTVNTKYGDIYVKI